jgi:hypothetical protein
MAPTRLWEVPDPDVLSHNLMASSKERFWGPESDIPPVPSESASTWAALTTRARRSVIP